MWRNAARWRPGAAKFDTWLHRVTLNLCYDRLRRRRERPTADPPERPDTGPAPGSPAAGRSPHKLRVEPGVTPWGQRRVRPVH